MMPHPGARREADRMFMSSDECCESLHALAPRGFVNGCAMQSIADDPQLAPGIAAILATYDYALDARDAAIATAGARRR
jgi:4-hydroxybutyryl-CoA dehydratase/vinylacetyl-CoA-Delta-isomerase